MNIQLCTSELENFFTCFILTNRFPVAVLLLFDNAHQFQKIVMNIQQDCVVTDGRSSNLSHFMIY